jgi:hypothetical protein
VTNGRAEMSTSCASSMIRLQWAAMRQPDVQVEMCMCDDLNDALSTALACDPQPDAIVAIDTRMGFPAELILNSAHPDTPDVSVGVYPFARVDWNRVGNVMAGPTTETLAHIGNTYNVTFAKDATNGPFIRVTDATSTALLIKMKPLREIAARLDPDRVAKPESGSKATRYVFARETVHNGAVVPKDKSFFLNTKGPIFAAVSWPCTWSGPAEFSGCVGARKALR